MSQMDDRNACLDPKIRAKDLLERMTLREKVGQLNQRLYGFSSYEWKEDVFALSEEFQKEVERYDGLGVLYGLYRADPWSQKGYENGLYGKRARRAYNAMQRYVIEHSRLGIPMLLSTESPHGHQALEGYLLPVNLAVGATFDPELYQKSCEICGRQQNAMGVDLSLVSMLDVLRDPRWGRSEECYGEDPVLCAKMAEAAARGYQNGGVTVVAKHLAAQGEGTGGINASAARIGERELREIHLPPMEACAQAGVGGVMAAYNEIDGVYCHANPHLLQDILRKEMGFDGIVMADGQAVDQLDRVTGNSVKSGALALHSGVDVGLWDEAFGTLEEAIQGGYVGIEELDQAVLRVLTLKFQRGLFENPYLSEEEQDVISYMKYPESQKLAEESIVLLKNEGGILPLKKGETIAVIGSHADDIYHQLGDYSPPLKEGEGVTLLKGIRDAGDFCVSEGETGIRYAKGAGILDGTKEERERAVRLAEESDVVILTLGGSSSRFGTVTFDKNGAALAGEDVSMDCGEGVDCASLELPKAQKELAEAIYHTGKPVITVIVSGRPMILEECARNTKALLQCFYPGPMGGTALGKILFGEVSPSGVLPVSMPKHVGQLPVYYNYKSSYQPWSYYDYKDAPLYPFGYGLSYSHFICKEVETDKREIFLREWKGRETQPCLRLRVHLQNIGNYDADAVLLLYIHDREASTVRRVSELKDFCRSSLKAGEECDVFLKLTIRDLQVWNSKMKREAEPGGVDLILSLMGETIWRGELLLLEA